MFELTIILVCIALNGLLACSETAFIATDKYVLKGLSETGSKEGRRLLKLRQKPERVLSVIQIGISFVGAFAAAIGGAGAQASLTPWIAETFSLASKAAEIVAMLIIVIPLTYISVVFGELVPKAIALKKPVTVATRLVHVLSAMRRVMLPIAWLIEWPTKAIINALFKSSVDSTGALDVDDVVSKQGREYIINLFKIEKARVTDALIEWSSVDWISDGASMEEVEDMFITSGHTRLPVMADGGAIGIVNSKEFFALRKANASDWPSLVRPPVVLHKDLRLLDALKALQKDSAHMGIVSRGAHPIGIITMEDIFEEIVGEIYDEDDFGSIQEILSRTHYYR